MDAAAKCCLSWAAVLVLVTYCEVCLVCPLSQQMNEVSEIVDDIAEHRKEIEELTTPKKSYTPVTSPLPSTHFRRTSPHSASPRVDSKVGSISLQPRQKSLQLTELSQLG